MQIWLWFYSIVYPQKWSFPSVDHKNEIIIVCSWDDDDCALLAYGEIDGIKRRAELLSSTDSITEIHKGLGNAALSFVNSFTVPTRSIIISFAGKTKQNSTERQLVAVHTTIIYLCCTVGGRILFAISWYLSCFCCKLNYYYHNNYTTTTTTICHVFLLT